MFKSIAMAVVLLVTGCGAENDPTITPAPAAVQDAAPPLCSWSMTQPALSSDAIWNPGDGVDCVTPDAMPNGTYQIGLYTNGVRLVFHATPGLHAEVDGDPDFHLIAIGDEGGDGYGWTCYDWVGRADFALGSEGWALTADLVCTKDGQPRAVSLTLSGRRR